MTRRAYDNTNRGALFRNDDKAKDDARDYDYSGSINIAGVDYWLSGWVKTSKKGTKFLSPSVKPKDAPVDRSLNDEIPF